MASKIKDLQDRAAAVAAELDELHQLEDRTDEQNERLERLNADADKIVPELQHEKAIADRISSLRSQMSAAAAPVHVADAPKVRKAAQPRYGKLRGFASADDAEVAGRWIRGFILGREDDRRWYHDNVEERALSSTDNSKGGVFIPETFASTVIRLVDEFSSIPNQANVIPMSSDTLYIPRRVSGNQAYFVSDNSESTASDMGADNVMLSATECRVASRVPNSLIEDSVVDLAGLVAEEFALALSKKIDDSGFAGSGTSEFGGIRGIQWKFENETLTAGTNDSGESSLSAVTIDDFAETIGKLPSYARARAGWYVTPQVYSVCMLPLMLSAGGVSLQSLPLVRLSRGLWVIPSTSTTRCEPASATARRSACSVTCDCRRTTVFVVISRFVLALTDTLNLIRHISRLCAASTSLPLTLAMLRRPALLSLSPSDLGDPNGPRPEQQELCWCELRQQCRDRQPLV